MTVPVAVPVAAAVGPAARAVEEDKGNQPKEGEEGEAEGLALRSLSDHLRTVTDRRSAHGKVYEPAAPALARRVARGAVFGGGGIVDGPRGIFADDRVGGGPRGAASVQWTQASADEAEGDRATGAVAVVV